MESKIINIEDAKKVTKLINDRNVKIVLAGGCFDLLHIGHIVFFEEAKKHGDILIILLESDETITANKGPKRPINSQADRAKILAALATIDYIVPLKPQMTDKGYDDLVFTLKPAIIATTRVDSNRHHKERQADLVNAQVIDVTMPISDKSTTKLINLLNEL